MSDCKSNFTCKVCRGKHHSALHKDKSPVNPQQPKSSGHPPAASNTCATTALLRKAKIKATADVLIKNKYNQLIRCRAVIDNWSDENFISQSLVNTLQLPKEKLKESITVNGLQSQSVATVDHVTHVEITSYATTMNPPISTTALIVRKVLAAPTPLHRIDTSSYTHIQGLALADADYALPKNVDLLLGVEVFQQIVEAQLIKGTNDQPVAQNTKLGWIIYGVTGVLIDGSSDCAITATGNGESVDAILRKFWEVESLPSNKRNFTLEEEACENHYRLTTVRQMVRFRFDYHLRKTFHCLAHQTKMHTNGFLQTRPQE
ncbi:unnamed protein product [Allacma fusca]|uniref:Peptidase aspartic putative domain-containing protein n=1 Tax=Allacma fusca TaxID=39272 RepID=A0A8J2PJB6_9HEXA|nr:unnamed protein product [Allacma fusca]